MRSWGIYIAIALGAYALNASWQADRDSSGAIVGEGRIDAFKMKVGDCFNDASAPVDAEEVVVENVAGVPCSQPHDNEVFAIFDLAVPTFPEDGGMATLAFDSCLEHFEAFVGRDYETSALDIVAMYPTLESWTQLNDREVVCAVYDIELSKLEDSVKGLAL